MSCHCGFGAFNCVTNDPNCVWVPVRAPPDRQSQQQQHQQHQHRLDRLRRERDQREREENARWRLELEARNRVLELELREQRAQMEALMRGGAPGPGPGPGPAPQPQPQAQPQLQPQLQPQPQPQPPFGSGFGSGFGGSPSRTQPSTYTGLDPAPAPGPGLGPAGRSARSAFRPVMAGARDGGGSVPRWNGAGFGASAAPAQQPQPQPAMPRPGPGPGPTNRAEAQPQPDPLRLRQVVREAQNTVYHLFESELSSVQAEWAEEIATIRADVAALLGETAATAELLDLAPLLDVDVIAPDRALIHRLRLVDEGVGSSGGGGAGSVGSSGEGGAGGAGPETTSPELDHLYGWEIQALVLLRIAAERARYVEQLRAETEDVLAHVFEHHSRHSQHSHNHNHQYHNQYPNQYQQYYQQQQDYRQQDYYRQQQQPRTPLRAEMLAVFKPLWVSAANDLDRCLALVHERRSIVLNGITAHAARLGLPMIATTAAAGGGGGGGGAVAGAALLPAQHRLRLDVQKYSDLHARQVAKVAELETNLMAVLDSVFDAVPDGL